MAVDRLKMLRILPTDSLQSPSSLPLQGLQSLPCALPVQQAVHLRPAELQDRAPEDAQLSDAGCRTHALHEVSVSRKNPDDPSPQLPPPQLLESVTVSVCLSVCQESQHPGVLPAGRGPRCAAHVMALQRRPHRHAGQRTGACSRCE